MLIKAQADRFCISQNTPLHRGSGRRGRMSHVSQEGGSAAIAYVPSPRSHTPAAGVNGIQKQQGYQAVSCSLLKRACYWPCTVGVRLVFTGDWRQPGSPDRVETNWSETRAACGTLPSEPAPWPKTFSSTVGGSLGELPLSEGGAGPCASINAIDLTCTPMLPRMKPAPQTLVHKEKLRHRTATSLFEGEGVGAGGNSEDSTLSSALCH